MQTDQQNISFRAGAAKVDITPTLGTVINGEFASRYANHIADPLFAKALVLQGAQTTVAFVIVDICAMQKDFLDEVKLMAQRATGILPEQLLIASTHTHSAGSVTDLLMGHVDLAYRKRLVGLIMEALKLAFDRLRPAQLGFGSVDVPQHVLCRRYYMKAGYQAQNPVTGGLDQVKTNPAGDEKAIIGRASQIDPEVGYLAVRGLDGVWISLLANYSLHYVGDCERSTISADYFGHFSTEIGQLLGARENFVGMMSNGTSGEANIWDFMDPHRYPAGYYQKSRLIGREIATSVYHTIDNVTWETDPELSVAYEELVIRSRKPNAKEVAAAAEIVAATDYEHLDFERQGYVQLYAREQLLLNDYPDEVSFPVQVFKIGRGIVGGLGGEFFAETGLKLKNEGEKRAYFTICLANDYVGYVPPAHEIAKGGYETWRCRSSRLAEDAEETIRQKLSNMIAKR